MARKQETITLLNIINSLWWSVDVAIAFIIHSADHQYLIIIQLGTILDRMQIPHYTKYSLQDINLLMPQLMPQ